MNPYICQSDQISRDSYQYVPLQIRIPDICVILYPDTVIFGEGGDFITRSYVHFRIISYPGLFLPEYVS